MLKKIFIGLVVVIALVAIGVTVFVNQLDSLIAQTIEKEGTATLGSKVRVGSVLTNFKEGTATIRDLTVANPPGYQQANALKITQFNAKVDYDNQSIKDITINAPTINAEILASFEELVQTRDFKNIRSNFKDLIDNMPASEEQPATSADEESLTIQRFAIQNTTVNLLADQLGERTFSMDDFVLRNIMGTSDQISAQLTEKLTSHISNQIKNYATAEFKKLVAQTVKDEGTKIVKDALKDKLGKGALEDGLKELKLNF